jgi:hypothetical protein
MAQKNKVGIKTTFKINVPTLNITACTPGWTNKGIEHKIRDCRAKSCIVVLKRLLPRITIPKKTIEINARFNHIKSMPP